MYTNLINSDSCQAAARVSHCCPCTPSLTSFRGKKSALCSVKVGLIISYSCLMNRSHILSCADVLFRMSYTYLKDSLLISMSMHCPDAHVFPHDFLSFNVGVWATHRLVPTCFRICSTRCSHQPNLETACGQVSRIESRWAWATWRQLSCGKLLMLYS